MTWLWLTVAWGLELAPEPRWIDQWSVPLGTATAELGHGVAFQLIHDGEPAGFVFVGEGAASATLTTDADAVALANPLQSELGLDAGPAIRDRRWVEPADVVVVIGRSPVFSAPLAERPVLIDDQAVYLDPEGREVVVVTPIRVGRALGEAERALADRVAALTEAGLDPRAMLTVDRYRDDPRWLAEWRTSHSWRPLLDQGSTAWLSASHDPTGAADDTFVDRVYLHEHAQVRVLSGARPRLGFEGARIEDGAVNVVVQAEGTGRSATVEVEAALRFVADTRTELVTLAIPHGDEALGDDAVVPVGAAYERLEVSVDGVPLERVGDRWGAPLDGEWDTGTFRLPRPLAPSDQVSVRVRWRDRWAVAHVLDVKAFGVERYRALGVCTSVKQCSALVALWPEWIELGRVAGARRVVPIAPDRPGAWPAEVRVGTTMGEAWRAAIGGTEPLRDGGDGRWWIADTDSGARVSFGDLNERAVPAIGPYPAIRMLQPGPPQGSPSFLRAALQFYSEALPPYPYRELVFVQGPDVPTLTVNAAASPSVELDRPAVEGYPGQIVVTGLREVGGAEQKIDARWPKLVDRGVVEALAGHWWDRPAYARRDRWIAAAARGWMRDRFVDEAWGDAVAADWERSRRLTADVFAGHRRFAPLAEAPPEVAVGVLRALAARVGEPAFLRGLDGFLRGGVPTTEALQQALSRAAGVDLGSFFTMWVHVGAHPEVTGSWSASGGALELELHTDVPYGRCELPVGVVSGRKGETRISWVPVVDGVGKATIAVKGEPTEVTVDPERWLPLRGARGLPRR